MGVAIASAVISSWLFVWAASLAWGDASTTPLWLLLPWIMALSFLYTGLFITAHDGMHGTIAPGRPLLNYRIAQLSVFLYACFSLKHLREEHFKHHQFPGQVADPDWNGGKGPNLLRWYFRFMFHYLRPTQLLLITAATQFAQHGLGIPLPRIMAFWVIPSLLSTLQLFYFGTYLPHRDPLPEERDFVDAHRARSAPWTSWITLLTCYHFGIHHEHHLYPSVPWWRLPSKRLKLG